MFLWLYRAIFGQPITPSVDDSILLCTDGEQEKHIANDEYNDEDVIPDEECTKDIGVVTMVNEHYGLIDGQHYFEHDRITLFEEGMIVDYFWHNKDGGKKIHRVIEPVEPEFNESENFHKKIVTQVVKRHQRTVYASGGISFDLNDVIYTFIPAIGDWLEVECIVEIDENQKDLAGDVLNIVKVNALRSMTIVGEIRVYNPKTSTGIIEDNISFNKTNCTPGYMPRVGDMVSADVIESTQDNCNWRALNVTPESSYQRPHDVPRNVLNMDDIHFGDKGNVVVSKVNKIKLQDIGDQILIEIRANNRNTESHEIVNVEIMSTESQLSLVCPLFPTNITLLSHDIVTFTFRCQAKFLGSTKELVIIDFNQFKIGRWVHITVGNSTIQNGQSIRNPRINGQSLAEAARKSFVIGEKRLVAGQRLVRPPAFIVNKLPLYEVPERFAKKMFRELETNSDHMAVTKIERIAPFLLEQLNERNYKEIFHTLLYMEELTIQVHMRRYDMKHAKFDVCGAYFRLEVPDLLERRPSVVIGDRVIAVNPNDPDGHRFEGFVHRTSAKHIFLGFHPQFHAAYAGEDFAIEFYSSRTNFRRYHHAINIAMKLLGPDFLFPVSVPKREPQIDFVIETKHFRNLKRCEDEQIKREEAANIKNGITRMKDKKTKVLFWFDKTLNHYQKLAVKNIISGQARPLPYLLFGPPGTGKTVTLIETILQIHQLIRHSRILVIGPSNSAADLIALRLLDSAVLQPGELVRMVAYRCVVDKTIPARLIPYSMTGDLAREGSRQSKEHLQNGVRMSVRASEVGRHRIIIATCAVVGSLYTMGFPPGHFTHIVIDEAGQISEPEIMIPLSLLDVHTAQTILAGDPLQLGPCIFSRLARDYGLGESYFERMIKCNIYKRDPIGFPDTGGYDPRLVTRLVYNYRSLPEILALSNDLFYDSELIPMITSKEGSEVDLLKQVRHILPERREFDSSNEEDVNTERLPPAVVFHGIRGHNLQTSDSPSWFNPTEAGQVVNYLRKLYKAGLTQEDIGIITPYTKQCAHLRELISGVDINLPKIGSVEEFQGQEFKVVIMSTVRSNEDGARTDGRYGLGFIASPHRLNVAVSRAQALLIIIGNPHLLITDHYWRSVIMYAVNLGGYRGCDLPDL